MWVLQWRSAIQLSIELPDEQAEKLVEVAKRLGLQPSDLVNAAVSDLVGRSDEDFLNAFELVLNKNSELYKRLT